MRVASSNELAEEIVTSVIQEGDCDHVPTHIRLQEWVIQITNEPRRPR